MRCHKCSQDSIKIHVELDVISIRCDICGLDIECGDDIPHLCDLFIYNENLEEAEKLGKEALIEGKFFSDNPYSIGFNQLILNKRWELGYNREKESYEYNALSLSAEKIQNQLKTEIRVSKEQNEALNCTMGIFLSSNYKLIMDHCSKLLSRRILGLMLKKVIHSFQQDIKILYKKHYNWSE